jgi:hypothetical protein
MKCTHSPINLHGIFWCKNCGAIKIEGTDDWLLPLFEVLRVLQGEIAEKMFIDPISSTDLLEILGLKGN